MNLALNTMAMFTIFLSLLFGGLFGFWYGIIFVKRMRLYQSQANTSKKAYFSAIALSFLLNYVLLLGGLVLLMKTVALNTAFFLCALLTAFGLNVYQLIRRSP
jgi:hypothetical protein